MYIYLSITVIRRIIVCILSLPSYVHWVLIITVSDAIKAVNPFLKRVPRDQQDAFLLDCLNELAQLKTQRNDGKTVARYALMVAHLQRGE